VNCSFEAGTRRRCGPICGTYGREGIGGERGLLGLRIRSGGNAS
jgi:hypothetical protein